MGASLICLGNIPAQAQTAFVDFNTAGLYTNHFNPWNDAGGANGGNYAFQEGTTAGVSGSGGVSVWQSTDTTAVYTNQSWNFSVNGAAITVSTMVHANGLVNGADKVQLGILNSNNNGLNGNAGVAFESFRFFPGTTTWSLHEQFRTANANNETTLGNVNYTVGHWYKFVVSVTNTAGAAGNYSAGCAIYDYGTDGLTPGANIVTFPTATNHTGQTDVTVASMWPGFRAFQDGGIDAWDDFLVYTPASKPVITLSLTNTQVAQGTSASFLSLADGPGNISYSWYTNGIHVGGASGSTYTTPAVNNTYSNVMVVASNSNGSTSNSASITVFVPGVATLTNLPASSVGTGTATLNGQVLTTGGTAPTITIYYGPVDGGTNPSAWSNSVNIGTQAGTFSQAVSGLTPNTTYYYAAQGVNAGGTSWATPSQSFTTLPINPASIDNSPATAVQATFATLNGQVTSTGNDAPTVTFFYGTVDGGTSAGAWANNVGVGVQSGAVAQTVSGLSANTTYYFTAQAVNGAGTTWATPSSSFTTLASNSLPPAAAVLTHHNDNLRSGRNLNETTLNTSNVNSNQFGLLYTRPVDDQIYAQPLIMTNVNIPGRGTHNLVIVATVNDSVYAFDADDQTVSGAYWTRSFTNANARAPMNSDMTGACGGAYQDFSGKLAIVGTPAIDPVTGTIYLVARTIENGSTFVQRLHALDPTSGADLVAPAVISATYPGTGDGSVGGVISFDPQRNNQRPGLTLVNGMVYIAWSSHCDWGPYHGWVIGYNATNLSQVAAYATTPNCGDGGIWMSGQGLAADPSGNLYFSTGNTTGGCGDPNDRGESLVKLSLSGGSLSVASFFTPFNHVNLDNADADLGSGGLLLIPGTTLALCGGKQGLMYLVNRDNMGGLGTTSDNVVQSFQVSSDQIHGGPIWYDGPTTSYAYTWPSSTFLQQFTFNKAAGMFTVPAFAQSPTAAPSGQPGGLLAITANGTNAGTAILWASHQLTGDANQSTQPGIVHAYDARNVANELWNSQQNSARDAVGNFAKFVPPTVANGKLYLATFSSKLDVYGLLPVSTPQMAVSPASLNFGPITIGQNSTQTFHVANIGSATLNGTAAAASPFSISSGTPFSVAAGQTGSVMVAFSPGSSANFSNVVVFTSNGGNSDNTVTGSGVTAAHLAVSPASLNFGTVAVGGNAQANFVITNTGGAALTGGGATVPAGPFTIVSGSPFTLPGFGSTNLVVRFTPASAAFFSNNVTVTTANGGNSANAVTGTGALPLNPSFSGNPTSGLKPLPVTFTDTSTGTITNRFWDFGDGANSNTTGTSVLHTYAAAGTNTVSLTISGPLGTNQSTKTAYIVVTNPPPVLTLNPTNLDFGQVIVSQSATQAFDVINTGGQTLSGSVTSSAPFAIVGGTPFSVSPGQTSQVMVAFSPASSGNFSNGVEFTSNGGNSTNSVTGVGLTPAHLAVSPASLDFGPVAVGGNAQADFVVTNTGGAALSGGTASIPAGPFTILSGTPFDLPGFGSTNLSVQFAPASVANFSNNVTIATSNGGNSTNAVTGSGAIAPAAAFSASPTSGVGPLPVTFTDSSAGTITNRFWDFGDGANSNTTGTGVLHTYSAVGTYAVSLTVSGPLGADQSTKPGYIVVTNPPPQLTLNPTNLDFGQVIVSQSATQTFDVINTGGQTLSGSVTSSAPFAIVGGTPFSVSPGQTSQVMVAFSPMTSGNFSNVVEFSSDGGNSTNTVTGVGLTPPQLLVSPASLDFGVLAVGNSGQANFVITNTGGATLSGGTATVSAGPFTILSGTPFDLPGFGSTNLVINFAPSGAGYFSDNVIVSTTSSGSSTNPVTGSGAVSPTAGFSANPSSGSWPLTVTFSDTSTGTITNEFWDFGDGANTNAPSGGLTHTYTGPGTNTVSLTASGPVGVDTLTQTGYIVVTNPGPVTLSIALYGGQVQVTWSQGVLLSSDLVVGPYTNILSTNSPFIFTPTGAVQFLRVRVR